MRNIEHMKRHSNYPHPASTELGYVTRDKFQDREEQLNTGMLPDGLRQQCFLLAEAG